MNRRLTQAPICLKGTAAASPRGFLVDFTGARRLEWASDWKRCLEGEGNSSVENGW